MNTIIQFDTSLKTGKSVKVIFKFMHRVYITEHGQFPNTITLGISETINPTKKSVHKIFIII